MISNSWTITQLFLLLPCTAEFEAYLKKQKPGEGSPAKMVDGICQMNGKAKIAFIPVSFVGKFGITDTEEGPKIEKIVVSRS